MGHYTFFQIVFEGIYIIWDQLRFSIYCDPSFRNDEKLTSYVIHNSLNHCMVLDDLFLQIFTELGMW